MGILMRFILLGLLSYFLYASYNKNGVEGGWKISKGENVELEKQLKILNKPAIKTVQTKYGDVYDCVDFYKQPAFDHPLLKNHTFHYQMKPSSVPQVVGEKELSITNTKVWEIGLKGIGCPLGAVPIRRVTKDDLIRFKLHSKQYGSKYSVFTQENPGIHYSVVKTSNQNKKYNGGGTSISTYNPSVNNSQYSSGRMKIQNGHDSIQIGWTVNPTLYGDNRTHLYTYLSAGQSRCFNTQCPGFVVVNADYPIDQLLDVSKLGGPTFFIKFLIYRDQANGNWWLELGPNNTQVGFWPHRIFTDLADMATTVEWGGEVFSPPDAVSPPMGSGLYVDNYKDKWYNAFCKLVTIINDAHEVVDAIDTEEYNDSVSYEVKDLGNVEGIDRHTVFFGGPGGATGQ